MGQSNQTKDNTPNSSTFWRRYVFTRENAWVLLVCLMLLLIFVFGTMGVQPRFVYSGF
jgi:hypothetical protein